MPRTAATRDRKWVDAVKALVFQGPGRMDRQDVPDPVIEEPGDAIVRVDVVAICGTAGGRSPSADLVTHRFETGEMEEAYEAFDNAAETGALEVALGGPQRTAVSLPDTPVA
ncbi:hypothetical protein [Streptomyces sp. NPDC018711]|uniref:hypothetical protein n=1 Tax=Streptomyces sp. NPDC018711 TaxID=3365052 RepID=UPI0037A78D3B